MVMNLDFAQEGLFSDIMSDEGYHAKSYNYDDKMKEWMKLPEKRFDELLGYLEESEHPFDFVAMGIHGTDDDNAIPNPNIVLRINEWNEKHGEQVEVKLVSLTDFFDSIRENTHIKTYEGDWADWWSDGIGTAPFHFKYFKRLQNEYLYYKKVAKNITKDYEEEIETTMALFAEHTFGHFLSIQNPYLTDAGSIQLVKESHIGRLVQLINDIKYKYYNAKGANNYTVNVSNKFLLINPTNEVFKQVVTLKFDKFDLYTYTSPYKITDSKGKVYHYFMKGVEELRASVPHIYVELQPNEELEITVDKHDCNNYQLQLLEDCYKPHAGGVGLDRLTDIHPLSIPKSTFLFGRAFIGEDGLDYNKYAIKWDKTGIYSIYDKSLSKELLNNRERFGAPIFEMMKDQKGAVRDDKEENRRYSFAGRNKKNVNV